MHTRIADALNLDARHVAAAVELLDDGNTVPFIARYRKERTGGLDAMQLRAIEERAIRIRRVDDRRATILVRLADTDQLTSALERQLAEARSLPELEDLYAPFRPRRLTRAARAIEGGLEPVARLISTGRQPSSLARTLTSDAFPTVDDVLGGAKDILAEELSNDPWARGTVRRHLRTHGILVCDKRRGADVDPTYQTYYGFRCPVRHVRPHQILAIRRGERLKLLSARITIDTERVLDTLVRRHVTHRGPSTRLHREAVVDGLRRLLHPSVERDVRGELDEAADTHAISTFGVNLERLLLQAPLTGRRVLGVDPGYRTGCKVAAVDSTGRVLGIDRFFVHDGRRGEAPDRIRALVHRFEIDVVAIGNGTASSETQAVVSEAIAESDVKYAVVDEAGASVYSASDLAHRELPDMDVSYRGAVSIARRLQDPLAERIKIDPQSIGVGLYQHDVDSSRLARTLDGVVEDAVNHVGVDLRTASERLLTYVSGIGPTLAERIVGHRDHHGIRSRRDLLSVRGLGARTFEQCAGFLRLREGDEPLDATAIHPEHYPAARAILRAIQLPPGDPGVGEAIARLRTSGELERLATRFELGSYTLHDLVEALRDPLHDPRRDATPPQLHTTQLSIDELTVGTKRTGTIRNVVDFGAFVDIGAKQDGLVHVSKLADRFVRDPHQVVAVGDQVEVTVVSVDLERGRIGLSMID